MNMFLWISLFVIAVISLFLFTATNFIFEFSYDKCGKKFSVTIKHLFLKIKLKPPKKKGTTKNPNPENKGLTLKEKVDKGITLFKSIEDDIVEILSYASGRALKIKELDFLLNFGTGDAMGTGIITGGAYGVIYNLIALFDNNFSLKRYDVKINPDFENRYLSFSAKCILEVRNVHIIIMIFKVLKMYLKINKITRKED